MKICVTSILPCSAEEAWQAITQIGMLQRVSEGMLVLKGQELPTQNWELGQTYFFEIQVGLGKPAIHQVRVVQLDRTRRYFTTEEQGGNIRSWRHEHRIESIDANQCRYTDEIEFSAGTWTPLIWIQAQILYRFRHKNWKRLLKNPAQKKRADSA